MAVALAMRVWALRWQPFVTVDGTEYVRFAEALRAGKAFVLIFPPGYPALIVLAHLLVADRVLAAALVSLLCGVLLVWPVWWLGRRALGPRWAWLPVLAVALHPTLAVFSAISMSESGYFLALYAGLALAAAARALPAGLVLGAAFAIFLPKALVPAAALAAGGTWRVVRLTPQPAGSGYGRLQTLEHNWRLGLRQHPVNAVMHGRSLLQLWPAPLLLLSLVGLARRRGLEAVPLLHLAAIPLLGLSRQPRFVLGAIPALAVLAVVPIVARRGRWRARLATLALAGTGWCGVGNGRHLVRPFDSWIDSHQRAGVWLSGVAEPGSIVMDRRPWVAFYAHCTYRVMPDEPYDALVNAAVQDHVRYLVVEQQFASVLRRQLEPLLYDAQFRDREQRLELAYVGGRVAGYGLGIFQVLQPGERKTGRPPTIEADYLTGTRAAPAP